MKKILITGGSGYLGSRLTQIATASGHWHTFPTFFTNPIDHPNGRRLDLRDRAATHALIAELKPDTIIHQAVSPRTPADIAAIIPAARNILDAALDHHAHLIFVSTDMVFDGHTPPYFDDTPPAPVNEYAAAKAFAEDLIMRTMPDEALIVRPSLIYGFDPLDKQTSWLVDGIKSRQTVRLFTNEIRCPIWVDTVSHALLEMADLKLTGRINLGGLPLNRWEIGLKLLTCLGLDLGPTVVASESTPEMKRPADLTLISAKALSILATPILPIERAFAQHQRLKQR
jgi:dTDP-4-dehydrorhamnose reductase